MQLPNRWPHARPSEMLRWPKLLEGQRGGAEGIIAHNAFAGTTVPALVQDPPPSAAGVPSTVLTTPSACRTAEVDNCREWGVFFYISGKYNITRNPLWKDESRPLPTTVTAAH